MPSRSRGFGKARMHKRWRILDGFSFERRPPCLDRGPSNKTSRTPQPSPTTVPDLSQTGERVRRRHDCQPQAFAETLSSLAGRTRRTTVQRVSGGDHQVLHQCRGRQVEPDQRLVPCTVSALVLSLRELPRLVRRRHRGVHRCTPSLQLRKLAARAVVGRGKKASWQC